MQGKITEMYFSPTYATEKITKIIANELAQHLDKEKITINLTKPASRGKEHRLGPGDLLVFGFPVYGGRIPQLLKETLSKLEGNNTPAIVVGTYGNRDYDDALLEAKNLLQEKAFIPSAFCVFIGEHSYSRKLAANRPDEKDRSIAVHFAQRMADKLKTGTFNDISVKGSIPYKSPMAATPFLPKTKENCTDCKVCARVCPMGIISEDDPNVVKNGCIGCNACIKSCPVSAKYFDAEPIDKLVATLEANFMVRKEPELFL